jgi:thermolabile hemolysin
MRRQCQATEQGAPAPIISSTDASSIPRLKTGITTTLFAFLLGCSSLFEEPAPDKAISADTWQVHCETASSHRPSDKELNKGVDKPIWLVALDSDNKPFELRGTLEDGFLRLGPAQPDETELLDGCVRALVNAERSKANEVARVRAFRHHERINVAIQYPGDDGPGLSRVIIFGDSLSDTGNMKARLRIFPAAPYWIGRFSNGPAWPDYLGSLSYVAIRNHAVGGASVSGKATIPKVTFTQRVMDGGQFFVSGTTEQQIDLFKKSFMTGEGIAKPEKTAVVVWAGANDYISKEPFTGAIETLLDRVDSPEGYPAVVATVIDNLERQIRSIMALGARHIVVGNLPDLGLTPIVLENKTYGVEAGLDDNERRLQLSQRLSQLTSYHNEQVAAMVTRLDGESDQVSVILFDAHTLFDNVLQYETYLDFDLSEEAEFDIADNARILESKQDESPHSYQARCYKGSYLGETDPSFVCDNSQRAVFWDVVHPTTYVHCWVAFGLHRRMHAAGWTRPTPEISEVGEWCEGVADLAAGHQELRVFRYVRREDMLSPFED